MLNTFMRKGKDPEQDPHQDPYLWGPKTYRSYGSGSGTLILGYFLKLFIDLARSVYGELPSPSIHAIRSISSYLIKWIISDLLSLALCLLEYGLALLPPLVVDPGASHLTQQLQALRVRRSSHLVDFTCISQMGNALKAMLRIRYRVPFWPLYSGSGMGKKSGSGSGMNNHDHIS